MGRYAWDGWCSIEIPDGGWTVEADDGVVSLFHPEGVGAVNVSFARITSQEDFAHSSLTERECANAERLGINDVTVRESRDGSWVEVEGRSAGGSRYWRSRTFRRGEKLVTLSYNCVDGQQHVERAAVDRVLHNLVWEPPDVSVR